MSMTSYRNSDEPFDFYVMGDGKLRLLYIMHVIIVKMQTQFGKQQEEVCYFNEFSSLYS